MVELGVNDVAGGGARSCDPFIPQNVKVLFVSQYWEQAGAWWEPGVLSLELWSGGGDRVAGSQALSF